MPLMNIYVNKNERVKPLEEILPDLRQFTAEKLSCLDRKLASDEISIRIIVPEASASIADTEFEIKAHHYAERIVKQDKICLDIRKYINEHCPAAGSVYGWLVLTDLGHSAN